MYLSVKDRQLVDIYQQLLNKLKENIDPRLFETFFDDNSFELKSIENDTAIFVTQDEATASIIKSALINDIQNYLSQILETNIKVDIINKQSYLRRTDNLIPTNDFFKNSHLDPTLTFDTFVTGQFNKSAYLAGILASKNPSTSNPIFLYSNSGLGKTHLLNAIGNDYQSQHPESKVLYITSDDFLNEYVRYIKGKRADELRDFFSTVDMLLIDDIQFLAGKTETQNMFFNIFNSLISAKKQIVLTSDRAPEDLKDLPERLISRFKGGLTISIGLPTKDSLLEILKMKIKINGYELDNFDEESLDYITTNYCKNIRELNGALTNLLFAITTMEHGPKIDIAFVRKVFEKDEERRHVKATASIDYIIRLVADYFKLTEAQIKGKSRLAQIALARQISMYLAREYLGMTFQSIGLKFEKDHTTVMSNYQLIQKNLKTDDNLKETINYLQGSLLQAQSA